MLLATPDLKRSRAWSTSSPEVHAQIGNLHLVARRFQIEQSGFHIQRNLISQIGFLLVQHFQLQIRLHYFRVRPAAGKDWHVEGCLIVWERRGFRCSAACPDTPTLRPRRVGSRRSCDARLSCSAAFTCDSSAFHSCRTPSASSMLAFTSGCGVSKKLSESASSMSWRGSRFNKRFSAYKDASRFVCATSNDCFSFCSSTFASVDARAHSFFLQIGRLVIQRLRQIDGDCEASTVAIARSVPMYCETTSKITCSRVKGCWPCSAFAKSLAER